MGCPIQLVPGGMLNLFDDSTMVRLLCGEGKLCSVIESKVDASGYGSGNERG